jgi:NAD(P)-dependent dehydrogenase (short-subunit alcohol dehydrogenase family)/pimeloyl-ACP methyl ester carboxylesterase
LTHVVGSVQRVVLNGGVHLAAVEAGDTQRPTIVLIHGYPDTKELWSGVIAGLAERFHVVAYDVRGAGASSAPRGMAAYDLQQLGDDLLAVCGEVAAGAKVHLAGHDWGGIQGWEFATDRRFEGRLASFTAIAAPSLDQVAIAGAALLARGRPLRWLGRIRRSGYIAALLTPGGPTLAWRVLLAGGRWQWRLRNVERVPVDSSYPAPTLARDGVRGANLYRRNVPSRALRPRVDAVAHVPVQLIVPSGDRYIPESYYELAERYAPGLRRRRVAGSHWAPRTQPGLIARWIGSFVDEIESGRLPADAGSPWVRGGGVEQLRDRLALVTGAGSGIGAATARELAGHGARLLLVDRDGDAVARAAEALPGARALVCDVADEQAMERLADAVIAEHGAPQIVVNNAGIAVAGSFLDTGFDDWRRILGVNLMGVVHGCRLFGRAMVERGEGGQIVNTASAAAFSPSRSLAAYSASKAAVLMLSECLRGELGPCGIGVTAVCPGIVATNITSSTRYVGRAEQDQRRTAEYVTGMYKRRNFTAEQVAAEIVAAIAADLPVAVVTPEAKVMRALARVAPGALRRLAGLEALPI